MKRAAVVVLISAFIAGCPQPNIDQQVTIYNAGQDVTEPEITETDTQQTEAGGIHAGKGKRKENEP